MDPGAIEGSIYQKAIKKRWIRSNGERDGSRSKGRIRDNAKERWIRERWMLPAMDQGISDGSGG
jgi:hypothetical protein